MAPKWLRRKKKRSNPKTETANAESAAPTPDAHVPEAQNQPFAEKPETSPPVPEKENDPADPQDIASEQNTGQMGFLKRLRSGLSKTRQVLTTDIDELFAGGRIVDEEMIEELEERLITADISVGTTMELMDRIRNNAKHIRNSRQLREALKKEIVGLLQRPNESAPPASHHRPHVVMVVGVNGVGKTTTIGKLAAKAASEGKQVLIGAADTFRAAAIEQLTVWAQRAGADMVRQKDGADPAAVAFDSVAAGMARNADLVLIDTAGRLHTKVNLMEELKKIKRSIGKSMAGAPHEILLVIDATTGQNAMAQADIFKSALGEISSLALTKLDGTAKGGIAVSICASMNIPLRYVGVGESIQDLQPFDPLAFADALF